MNNVNNQFKDSGYVPFNLNSINKNITLDCILILDNGSYFLGRSFGSKKDCFGEICFNTSISGYQEIITDPSYSKQIITFTHPHIGNTGINSEDNESDNIYAEGVVIRNYISQPSNYRSEENLDDFLARNNSIGIFGIDTRQLTIILREKGSLKACISPIDENDEQSAISLAKSFNGLEGMDLAKEVTTNSLYSWNEGVWPDFKKSKSKLHIVAYDYGIKKNILRLLSEHVGKVTVVNAKCSFDEVLKMNPDGIFLSNGPGDPEPCDYAIENIKRALNENIPIFGICLGHQLLALAGGAKTEKMKFGHHGANHPVQSLKSKEVFITSQNHGFAVNEDSLPNNIEISHVSLFDQSIQGISFKDKPAFSFQGHPEASPGPQDIVSLFKQFKEMIDKNAKKK